MLGNPSWSGHYSGLFILRAGRFGVPASAGKMSAMSNSLKISEVAVLANAPPPEGGTPNLPLQCLSALVQVRSLSANSPQEIRGYDIT